MQKSLNSYTFAEINLAMQTKEEAFIKIKSLVQRFDEQKEFYKKTGDRIVATIIGANIICRKNLHIVISNKINQKFLLGLLNSKRIEQMQARIGYCEDRINEIVYELYGLTKEEIQIIKK